MAGPTKKKINAVVAEVSSQALCAIDISPEHELASIGISETLNLVLLLEADVKDENGLMIQVCDEVWPSWATVGDVYKFYGVK